jgi:hypothetical protein
MIIGSVSGSNMITFGIDSDGWNLSWVFVQISPEDLLASSGVPDKDSGVLTLLAGYSTSSIGGVDTNRHDIIGVMILRRGCLFWFISNFTSAKVGLGVRIFIKNDT